MIILNFALNVNATQWHLFYNMIHM